MSRVYAYTEDGKRILIEVVCDGCEVVRKPLYLCEDKAEGWTHSGQYVFGKPDQSFEWDWCPVCSKELK